MAFVNNPRPFDRLQKLGEERFTKILNGLMRGETAIAMARAIQQPPPEGWGLFQDVAEKTLMQQLNRLRIAAAEGMYGAAEAKRVLEVGKPHIDRLRGISVPVLARLEELSEKQKTLVYVLLEKATSEKRTFKSINEAVDIYRQTLLDLQKIRFDLGLDDFKGPAGVIRGAKESVTLPDGTNIQRQVFEAVNVVEQILDARKIPALHE